MVEYVKGDLGIFEYDDIHEMYWCRHKLSNGQFCMIGFEYFPDEIKNYEEYNVVFAVADKKKQLREFFKGSTKDNITLKRTGKCGLEALLWAKDMILEFEEELRGFAGYNITIAIVLSGEDKHRFRIYERGLHKHGYKKVPGAGKGDYPWYMKKIVLDKGQIPQS